MTEREKEAAGEAGRREVAPGLLMEKRITQEADGRYLIYYNFCGTDAREPTMAAVTLSVPEIVCETCAGSIRQAVSPLPGVTAVDVDVAQKQVRVAFDSRQADERAVRTAIEQAGFEVAG